MPITLPTQPNEMVSLLAHAAELVGVEHDGPNLRGSLTRESFVAYTAGRFGFEPSVLVGQVVPTVALAYGLFWPREVREEAAARLLGVTVDNFRSAPSAARLEMIDQMPEDRRVPRETFLGYPAAKDLF